MCIDVGGRGVIFLVVVLAVVDILLPLALERASFLLNLAKPLRVRLHLLAAALHRGNWDFRERVCCGCHSDLFVHFKLFY